MPSHIYHPVRNPPNAWDRFLVHPWDNVISVLVLFVGAALAVSGFVPVDAGPFNAIGGAIAVVATGAVLFVGGALAIVGLHWQNDDNVARGWQIERTGWILVAGGALSYSVAIISTDAGNILSGFTTLSILIGALGTAVSRWYIERATKSQRDKLESEGMEL